MLIKRILFPTDFSETANNAFIYTLEVADKLGAEIITLHVYQKPELRKVNLPNTLTDFLEEDALEDFENYRSSIPVLRKIAAEQNLSHISVKHVIKEGPIVSTAIKTADVDEVDLIILGTKGSNWMRQIFFGSVAGELLERANVPVLAVPKGAVFDGFIDKIALTVSYAEAEEKALNQILAFAQNFDAEVYAVHVDATNTNSYAQKMEAWKDKFSDYGNLHFRVIPGDGRPMMEQLSGFLESRKVDFVAMVTHKRGFFEELFSLSHAKKMSYSQQTPVLSIQAHIL